MQYWLLKTEPESFSIDDLAAAPRKTTYWDGVRNYQARNFLRDQMRKGDLVLLHHSNAKPPCVVGVAKVVREGYPDFTAWDPDQKHYDPKSTPDNPTWFMVDIRLVKKFRHPLSLDELRQHKSLEDMELLRKGSRLSVQPVRESEYQLIVELGS